MASDWLFASRVDSVWAPLLRKIKIYKIFIIRVLEAGNMEWIIPPLKSWNDDNKVLINICLKYIVWWAGWQDINNWETLTEKIDNNYIQV